eukprot:scaffold2915_cov282-Prasinococcus_capsulatus_cf.AAC.5
MQLSAPRHSTTLEMLGRPGMRAPAERNDTPPVANVSSNGSDGRVGVHVVQRWRATSSRLGLSRASSLTYQPTRAAERPRGAAARGPGSP